MPANGEDTMADERRDQPTTDEGALDPNERFGQGTDASHPESATGQPLDRTDRSTADDEPDAPSGETTGA